MDAKRRNFIVEGDGFSDLCRALEEIAKITRKMLIIWMVILRGFITMFRLLGLFITEEYTMDLMHI